MRRTLSIAFGIGVLALQLATGTPALAGGEDGIGVGASGAPTCQGKPATIVLKKSQIGQTVEGTNDDDIVVGTDGSDAFLGLGGNDKICLGRGNDTVQGGDGNDLLFGGRGADTLNGGNGNDQMLGQGGGDRLFGGVSSADTGDLCDGGTGTDEAPDIILNNPPLNLPNGCDTLLNIP